jgi:hypothetical protein
MPATCDVAGEFGLDVMVGTFDAAVPPATDAIASGVADVLGGTG